MLPTGETYTTSVGKARPESVDEDLCAIEEDLSLDATIWTGYP